VCREAIPDLPGLPDRFRAGTLWAIAAILETMAALNKAQVWPASAIDWIRGLSIIGLASAPPIRPVPPALVRRRDSAPT